MELIVHVGSLCRQFKTIQCSSHICCEAAICLVGQHMLVIVKYQTEVSYIYTVPSNSALYVG